jgi:peptidoglycan/xylan/chitin deacetylase (PgdA/CDA1 family)
MKKICLTFDDGPHEVFTPIILDILKQYNIKATFFIVGNRVSDNKDIIKRIIDEGHDIGNHSYNHERFSEMSDQDIFDTINNTNNILNKYFNYTPKYVRAPYGRGFKDERIISIFKKLNLIHIFWNIDPRDWDKQNNYDAIIDNVLCGLSRSIKNKSIIIFHDCNDNYVENETMTIKALRKLIPILINEYQFVKLDE